MRESCHTPSGHKLQARLLRLCPPSAKGLQSNPYLHLNTSKQAPVCGTAMLSTPQHAPQMLDLGSSHRPSKGKPLKRRTDNLTIVKPDLQPGCFIRLTFTVQDGELSEEASIKRVHYAMGQWPMVC